MRRWQRHHTAFSTHYGAAIVRASSQFVKSHSERVRRRVIGVVSKSRDPPEGIGRWHRSLGLVAQTAKGGQMTIRDPSVNEHFRESIGVELRIRPRAWDRAHINEQIDGHLPEQSHKFGDCAGRMAYREDRRYHRGLSGRFLGSIYLKSIIRTRERGLGNGTDKPKEPAST